MIKKLMKKYFQSFLFFYRYIGYRVFIVFLNSLIVGVLDGLGLTLFIPLLQATSMNSASNDSSLGKLDMITEFFDSVGIDLTINVVLLLMLTVFVLKGIFKYWEKYYAATVRFYFLTSLRNRFVDGLKELRYQFFVQNDSGRIQNTISSEVARASISFNKYIITLQNIVLVCVYSALAFASNAQFALLVVLAGLVTNFIYKRFYIITKKWSREVTQEGHQFHSFLIQSVQNFKYLKATNLITKYSEKLKQKVESTEKANLKIGKIDAMLVGSREAFTISIVLGVIFIHVNVLHGTIASVILSLMFFYRSMGNLMNVQNAWNGFLANIGAIENINLFSRELSANKERSVSSSSFDGLESIEIKGLSFSYDDKQVLNNINLSIAQNETLAFVGESGSGKTTLMNLICGLLDRYAGEILINGTDLRQLNKLSYQHMIGYITQEPVIFNDSIANNISLWETSDKQKLDEALRKAAILDYVNSLPEKEQSNLGDNGVLISGGQKQRISIARELYKESSLLLLDEATSALDSETEKVIQKNIESLHGSITMLIIAHRLSTIKNVDRIVILDNGSISDIGTFDELMERSAMFRRMVELQEFK